MRTILHTMIGQHTAYNIHRVMKEKKCKKSEALDHIVTDYERFKRDEHVNEVANWVIRNLRDAGNDGDLILFIIYYNFNLEQNATKICAHSNKFI